MTLKERKQLVRSYMGKTVEIKIDRPIGYVHHKKDYSLIYPINYGCIPGVLGGDDEELDVYLLGVDEAVEEYRAKIIGIVHRENDVEDKLVAAPEGMDFSKEEIEKGIMFQEQYYDTYVETESEIVVAELKNGKFTYIPREFKECFEYDVLVFDLSGEALFLKEADFEELIKRLENCSGAQHLLRSVLRSSRYVDSSICDVESAVWEHFTREETEDFSGSLSVKASFDEYGRLKLEPVDTIK